MVKKEQRKLNIKKWVRGTIITSCLPFFTALFRWSEDGNKMGLVDGFFAHVPYVDSIMLLYAIAVNCFILTLELEGVHRNRVLEWITRFISFWAAALSALYYMFLMGEEKTKFSNWVLGAIYVLTLLNFVLGLLYSSTDYKKIVETEKNADNKQNEKLIS